MPRLASILSIVTWSLVCQPLVLAETPQRLTSDGFMKRDPLVWPNGEYVAYSVEKPGTGRMRLAKLKLSDGSIEFFHSDKNLSDREITCSADGKIYAYNSVRGLSSSIIVHNTQTQKKSTIPQQGIANWQNWPSLNPEGTSVVFTEGANAIFAYDLVKAGGKETLLRLTPDGISGDLMPKYSPDGKQIVFVSRRDSDFEIYSMNADGSGQNRVTDSRGVDQHASFSPDGQQIAFTSNRDGNYEIYVMRADGSHPTRVTQNPERDDFACWTSDGKHLIYVSERDGLFDLFQVESPRK